MNHFGRISILNLYLVISILIIKSVQCTSLELSSQNDQDLNELLRRTMQNVNPRSRYAIQDLANNNVDADEEFVSKRGGVWFGPRLGKRSKRSIIELPQTNEMQHDDIITTDDLTDAYSQKFNFEAFMSSPSVILLLQTKNPQNRNRILTPRLGREADAIMDVQRARPPFAPRLGKKALPFSPRLGRQLFG